MKKNILFALLLTTSLAGFSQRPSRTGTMANPQRVSEVVPCAGAIIFDEEFTAGLPGTWVSLDLDALAPRPELGLQAGWQSRADYDSPGDTIMVSPSWYTNGGGTSNDWLITPQIAVGNNSCLSWDAYSVDPFFPEAYEVRISTTGIDTADFMADSALASIGSESGARTTRAVSLAGYTGQNVYLAFRHTSNDKFVLALDNIRVSDVKAVDIGVLDISYDAADPGDTIDFTLKVANFGSDTITSFDVAYAINGGAAMTMAVDTVAIAPNAVVTFTHEDRYASDSVDMHYALCAWTFSPNQQADEDPSSDTTCVTLTVGSPVGLTEAHTAFAELSLIPNPVTDGQLRLRYDSEKLVRDGQVMVVDLHGRVVRNQELPVSRQFEMSLDLGDLPAGMYLLRVYSPTAGELSQRLLIQ